MKKVMTLAFLLALAIGANAQSITTQASDSATVPGSTVHVPPVAKPGPVAVPGGTKKK